MNTVKTYQLKHMKQSGANLGNIRTPVKRKILHVFIETERSKPG